MKKVADQAALLYDGLLKQLEQVMDEPTPLLQRIDTAIGHCIKALVSLKNCLGKNSFASPAEEIHFFKVIKPPFAAELLYYMKLRQLYAHWPLGGIVVQREYLNNTLVQLQLFFDEHREFYVYYRTNCTDRDHSYFLRGQPPAGPDIIAAVYANADTFSTGYDFLVATILCHDRLNEYINKQMDSPEWLHPSYPGRAGGRSPANWTAEKTALVEFGYALWEMGCCNNGKATLRDIMTGLEIGFNVELGDYSRTWIDVQKRNKDTPSFLEKLLQFFKKILGRSNNK